MASSLFSPPLARAAVHHIVATLLFTLYATQVSPLIETIPFITLLFQTGALFLLVYLLRLALHLIGIQTSALSDICLYTGSALAFAAWYQQLYGFPLATNLKIAFGMLILGGFITLDLALSQARVAQDHPNSFIHAPKNFIPLAWQASGVFIFFVLALTMLLCILASKELVWISQHDALALNIYEINAIMQRFLAVGGIFILYALFIAHNAVLLVRNQLSYQVQALSKAAEQQFDNMVPMNTLGELSIIAFYTNSMLSALQQKQQKQTPTEQQKQTPTANAGAAAGKTKVNPNAYRDDNHHSENTVVSNLAALIAIRDGGNRAHLMRIQRYVKALAVHLAAKGFHRDGLNLEAISMLYQCAPLYDIGKIAIPDNILKKPGQLTDQQLAIVKTHAQIGADVLNVESEPHNPFYKMARELALNHHEWWNGAGYPNGLQGKNIPITGRIMALADSYDALISKRAHRPAYDHEQAKEMIVQLRGTQFDPDVVDAFLAVELQFIDINRRYRDELLYTLVS